MLLLEQDTIKGGQMNEKTFQLEFEEGDDNKEYEVEEICDSMVYSKESEGYLSGFYYLVL